MPIFGHMRPNAQGGLLPCTFAYRQFSAEGLNNKALFSMVTEANFFKYHCQTSPHSPKKSAFQDVSDYLKNIFLVTKINYCAMFALGDRHPQHVSNTKSAVKNSHTGGGNRNLDLN